MVLTSSSCNLGINNIDSKQVPIFLYEAKMIYPISVLKENKSINSNLLVTKEFLTTKEYMQSCNKPSTLLTSIDLGGRR